MISDLVVAVDCLHEIDIQNIFKQFGKILETKQKENC